MDIMDLVFVRCMIACVVLLNTGCASKSIQAESSTTNTQVPSNANRAETNRKATAMVKKPVTPQDLLENIKWGMEQNVFLREDFYTEENIRRVLGDYPLRWEANDPKRKYLTIETNVQPLPSSDPNHRCISGAVLSWGIKSGGGPAPLAGLQIAIALKHDDPSCASFSADLIQSLFGKPTKVESIFPPGRPPPHGRVWVPGPTIHPLGNSDIEYVLGGAAISKRITFEIRGNGVATRLNLFMGEM